MKKASRAAKQSGAKKASGVKKKLRVGVLFGGRSGEHEISLLSAASILQAIDRRRYEVVPLGIDRQGRWLTGGAAERLLGAMVKKESRGGRGGGASEVSAASSCKRG